MADTCSICKFYSTDPEQLSVFGGNLAGVCRLDPPEIIQVTDQRVLGHVSYKAAFPQCTPTTWCGKFVTI